MIPVHVALVDVSETIGHAALAEVAGALNEQVQSDFAPIWHVRATVGAYPPNAVPVHTWRIELHKDIGEPGALGYHADDHFQPYSMVDVDAGEWTVTASHELLEMLADPWGSRLHTARVPQDVVPEDVGLMDNRVRCHYLVEVADPPEAETYQVGGVAVSDFILPDWYRTHPLERISYSHAGYCHQPRQVAKGGYVSFMVDGNWWQAFNWTGQVTLANLGRFDRQKFGSIREWTDLMARDARQA